jgi:hypothetical protein
MAKVTLGDLADPAVFKSIWKKTLRRNLRKARLPDFHLGHDVLEYAAFDWDLDRTVTTLCSEVSAGRFRASPPEVIRGAKSVGLTRPLAFLRLRDQLLYRVLVSRAENALMAASYEWTRFGRGDADSGEGNAGASGWFRAWLQRQNQIWVITSQHEWLVETDIANFFPYVDVVAVCEHVLARSNLDEDVVHLLEHMLRAFSPMRSYRTPRTGGLPQEGFDASRVLAHTYLKPVDDEFRAEGATQRYSRWVDDIVIGADSWQEALQQVRRAQTALERLGLYPNTAKTRIIPRGDFTRDYMKAENDYLGEVDQQQRDGLPVDTARFKRKLVAHVRMRNPHPKAWGRALRRYYTQARALDDPWLLGWWVRHLKGSPESAAHVLDYLSSYQLTRARFANLREVLEQFSGVYEDIELLAQEYLATAPNVDSVALREDVAAWALEVASQRAAERPRLAAAAILTVGKFGLGHHLDALKRLYQSHLRADSPARQQAAVILLATGRLGTDDLRDLLAHSDVESVQHVEFLRAVLAGESAAVGVAIGTVEPTPRQRPNRHMSRPRALFLAPLLAGSGSPRWPRALKHSLALLRSNPRRLRDRAAERWLAATL